MNKPPVVTSKDQMHPQDRRNLLIFMALAVAIWFSFDHFVMKPRIEKIRDAEKIAAEKINEAAQLATAEGGPEIIRPRMDVLAEGQRLKLANKVITGSINLTGNRIDDISLEKYSQTLGGKEKVILLEPIGTENPQYAETGWLADDTNIRVPGKDARWQVDGSNNDLTPSSPVTLSWDNGQGLRFTRTLTLDENYMIHVKQDVQNNSGAPVTLYPYSLVASYGLPSHVEKQRVIHEGPIGYIGGELIEYNYKKMAKKQIQEDHTASTGWIGITQKYWLTSLITDQNEVSQYRLSYTAPKTPDAKEHYQVDVRGDARVIEPGKTGSSNIWVFTGAKEVKLLEQYEETLKVSHFDLAVDFGLYYFLTKPFFYILDFFAGITGNFGIAIICLTIIVRICVFPLATASFRSFARLRKISPMMKDIREKYGHDRDLLQKELVKLYEREKVNPMAGCFPMLVQIPIFFALYKILMVTIEMRHAPFFGWIKDLSAQDPTTIFNLFGLIPWNPPGILMIGAWPCLMLFFMILQKKLNPPPQDKMQAMMFSFMPYMITFILASFPAGLVIYWTFSNALSIVQQYIITRKMGVDVELSPFTRKEDKEMEKAVHDGPSVHPELEMIEKKAEDALFDHDDTPKTVTPPKPRKKKKK